jgi:hypothetical protein
MDFAALRWNMSFHAILSPSWPRAVLSPGRADPNPF